MWVNRSRPLRILRVYSSSGVLLAEGPRDLTLLLVFNFRALPGNLNFAMATYTYSNGNRGASSRVIKTDYGSNNTHHLSKHPQPDFIQVFLNKDSNKEYSFLKLCDNF